MEEMSNKTRLWFNPNDFTFHFTQEESNFILYTVEERNNILEQTSYEDFATKPKLALDSNNKLKVINEEKTIEEKQEYIRRHRKECFNIVNRGNTWFNSLNEVQKEEIQIWYQAWLDAPDTLVIPSKPIWL